MRALRRVEEVEMIERTSLFNMRISEDERAKLAALAEKDDMPSSALVRRWIRQHYEARFGDVAPSKLGRKKG
jgi:transposase-like protein